MFLKSINTTGLFCCSLTIKFNLTPEKPLAARFGHVPKREKAKVLVAIPPPRVNTPESKVMAEMSNDTQLIETIVKAHFDTCDYTRNKMDPILQKARSNPNWITSIGPVRIFLS